MNLEEYLQAHYSADTVKAYKREIDIYSSNFNSSPTGGVEGASYKEITHYIGLLRQRYKKPATISRMLSAIKVYYDYLCDAGLRNDNPSKAIFLRDNRSRDVQLQDLFTIEELEALMNRKERFVNLYYRNKVLISLLIYQALHPAAMEAVRIADIDLNTGSIYIRATGKTNSRTLQLRPNQILLFHQYITEIRPKLLKENSSDKLLIGERTKAMPAEDITKHIKRSFKNLYPGRNVNAQTIRQSVITNLLNQGNDISIVQAFAGHKTPSTTERYKQSDVDTLKAAVNKYHPLS
jgi:integrase/recombinase XerD